MLMQGKCTAQKMLSLFNIKRTMGLPVSYCVWWLLIFLIEKGKIEVETKGFRPLRPHHSQIYSPGEPPA
jgi:hypothetical protein